MRDSFRTGHSYREAAYVAPPLVSGVVHQDSATIPTTTTTTTAPINENLHHQQHQPILQNVHATQHQPRSTSWEDDSEKALASRGTGAAAANPHPVVLKKSQVASLSIKNHILAMIGEFVGTVLFTFFAFGGTQVALIPSTSVTGATTSASTSADAVQAPNTSSLLFIALSFGFSLTVNAWVFFRISGGLFNPAISFGLALVGVITPVRAILLSIVQCAGAITGAALIRAILPGKLYVQTRLSNGITPVRGMFLEMFLTGMLMLTIFLLVAEKSKATFLAPIGIGLALFITQLVGVYWTGGCVNPARSLGPDVVSLAFPSYAWIYWVGPILGTLLAAGFYKMIKLLHYETVVPDQDADAPTAQGIFKPQGPGMSDLGNDGAYNMGADTVKNKAVPSGGIRRYKA